MMQCDVSVRRVSSENITLPCDVSKLLGLDGPYQSETAEAIQAAIGTNPGSHDSSSVWISVRHAVLEGVISRA